jgi:hypothetical protein
MQQMGEAMKEFEGIQRSEQQIQLKIAGIEKKNANIRALTGASFNTNNMLKRWENFQIASLEMGNILTDQKNKIQEDTLRKSDSLDNEANKVYRRYEQIRPAADDLTREQVLDLYGKIRDWQGEWAEVEAKFTAIESDIRHFGMKMPEFKGYHTIKQRLGKELGNWLFFMEFRGQVEPLEREEWASFRGSLNRYVDLVNDFGARAKGLAVGDQVAKFIREVLEENRQAVPLLRCITG